MGPTLSTACLALGVATAMASHASPAYQLQGGASGIATEHDYIENKIARGVYGVFGNAADEAKEASRFFASTAKSAEKAAKDHANEARKSVKEAVNKGTSFWQAVEVECEPVPKPKVTWIGGAKKVVDDEKRAVRKFFSNPNNAFVVQGLGALLVGCMHLFSYDTYVSKWATPIYKLCKQEIGTVSVVKSHAAVVGAFLVGIFLSDAMAYKSDSAGFKRGKVWSELCTNGAVTLAGAYHVLKAEDPTDVLPHVLAALTFTAWYGYLSKQY